MAIAQGLLKQQYMSRSAPLESILGIRLRNSSVKSSPGFSGKHSSGALEQMLEIRVSIRRNWQDKTERDGAWWAGSVRSLGSSDVTKWVYVKWYASGAEIIRHGNYTTFLEWCKMTWNWLLLYFLYKTRDWNPRWNQVIITEGSGFSE